MLPGIYSESDLIEIFASETLKNSYDELERFSCSKTKKHFLELLARQYEFTPGTATKPYTILKVLDVPVSSAEAKLHRGIYQYITPTLLTGAIGTEDAPGLFTIWEAVEASGLVNHNYPALRFRTGDVSRELDIEEKLITDFCSRIDTAAKRLIECCLGYLAESEALAYTEVMIVSSWKDEHHATDDESLTIERVHGKHKVTQDESALIDGIMAELERSLNIHSEREKNFGVKGRRYLQQFRATLNR